MTTKPNHSCKIYDSFNLLRALKTYNQSGKNPILKYANFVTMLACLIFTLYPLNAAAFRIGPFKFFESDTKEPIQTEIQNNDEKSLLKSKTINQNNTKEQNQNANDNSNTQNPIKKDFDKINSTDIQNTGPAQVEKQNAIINILNNAKKFIQTNGKKNAFTEFSKKDGLFTKGEVYIFAVSYDGTILAMTNPASIGVNLARMHNETAKYIFDLQLQTAKTGGGWINYRWINPVSQQIECKRSYIMPMEGYYIGTGYYFSPFHGGRCE